MLGSQAAKKFLKIMDLKKISNKSSTFWRDIRPYQKVLDKKELFDWMVGLYKQIYTGHVNNEELRYQSSSGGIATALLKYLFETNEIDKAFIAAPIKENPLKHRMQLIYKAEDAVRCNDTIYCQVDYSSVWDFIKNNDNGRLAVIGLPCQLKAIDLLVSNKNQLKIFKIGLF